MKKVQYMVIFKPLPEGGYIVTVPALPGCVTQGESLREARRMATDAIRAFCASLLKDGEPLPKDIRSAPVHEHIAVTLASS